MCALTARDWSRPKASETLTSKRSEKCPSSIPRSAKILPLISVLGALHCASRFAGGARLDCYFQRQGAAFRADYLSGQMGQYSQSIRDVNGHINKCR